MITEQIKKASALIRDVVYIAGLVVAAYLFLGKKAVEKERYNQSTISLQNNVTKNNKTDSIIITRFNELNNRFNNLSDTMKMLIIKTNSVISKQVKSEKGLTDLYKLTGRMEELINWYEK
jgi:hypothetical protein